MTTTTTLPDPASLAAAHLADPAARDEALREAVVRSNLATLRASLIAAGWTAESPAVFGDEAERGYADERADYDGEG